MNYLITHNDLDGVVCAIVMYNSIKNLQHKPIGYLAIEKQITEVSKMDKVNLIITDLNLRVENTESFAKMDNVKQILYIDHHLTNDINEILRIRKQYKNKLSILIDDSFAACKLCYNFSTKAGKDLLHLKPLVEIADGYDTWKTDQDYFFKYSRPLNDLFWFYGYDEFFSRFKNGFNGFSSAEKILIAKIEKERDDYLEKSVEKYGQVLGELLFVSNPEPRFANDYTLKFPDFQYFMVLKSTREDKVSFIFRVNVRNNVNWTDIVSTVKHEWPHWIEIGGHKKSGGITIETVRLEEFLEMFVPITETANPPF